MNQEMRDERLRRLLREADPGQGETGLTMEEVRAMRRTVLTAAPEPRRTFAFRPVAVGAVMAALVAIVTLLMWPSSESTMPVRPVPSKVAEKSPVVVKKSPITEQPSPPPSSGMNSRATEGVPSGTRRIPVPSGTTKGSPATSAPGDRIAAADIPENEDDVRTRQIQFSTPGGTRVIWILTSDTAL
jgi:hypothetical protein